MTNIGKKLEVLANLAIIIAGSLLAVVLVKNYLFQGPSKGLARTQTSPQPVERARLALTDVDWTQSKQTLLLVMSSSCHYCTESAPFYKRLGQSKNGTRLVAVLPESVEGGQDYLKRLGISVDEVRQSSLDEIDVQVTPTLLLVDNSGVVKKSWLGKLPPEQEESVVSALLDGGE
jgi:thiol-disulfide isomerase/thioredoxin